MKPNDVQAAEGCRILILLPDRFAALLDLDPAGLIGQLAGRLSTLSVAGVGYGLSREAREKVEGDASAQAIAKFRARAADYAVSELKKGNL